MSLPQSNFKAFLSLTYCIGACCLGLGMLGCSLLATRPVQEMSDTAAAIKAAREVQADKLAGELYRKAVDEFTRTKREYRLKNFDLAKSSAAVAKKYAEEAELEALKKGGTRSDTGASIDPYSDLNSAEPSLPPEPPIKAPSQPYPYPKPTGTPYERYEEERKTKTQSPPTPTPSPTPSPTSPYRFR